MRPFFYKLGTTVVRCFRGTNLMWHVLAVAITYVAVVSDFDWFYFTALRNTAIYPFFFPAALIGGLVPIIGPFLLLEIARERKNRKLVNAAYAFGQANLLGWAVSSAYKFFTGRVQPPRFLSQVAMNISHGFNFGLDRHGIFWGWPSSHTTVAFAGAVALIVLYFDRPAVKYLLAAYALYVGFGISFSIHWFSDFAAGAIIGTVIGLTVGKSFLYRYKHGITGA